MVLEFYYTSKLCYIEYNNCKYNKTIIMIDALNELYKLRPTIMSKQSYRIILYPLLQIMNLKRFEQ